MRYGHAHASIMDDACTKLARGPWNTGGVSQIMTVRPDGITRNQEERSWAQMLLFGTVQHDLNLPQADSLAS